jgi:hypothetical protein
VSWIVRPRQTERWPLSFLQTTFIRRAATCASPVYRIKLESFWLPVLRFCRGQLKLSTCTGNTHRHTYLTHLIPMRWLFTYCIWHILFALLQVRSIAAYAPFRSNNIWRREAVLKKIWLTFTFQALLEQSVEHRATVVAETLQNRYNFLRCSQGTCILYDVHLYDTRVIPAATGETRPIV